MAKIYQRAYTDGVAYIYEDASPPSAFGGRTNADSMSDLKAVCPLRFRELSCRQEDLSWAEMEEINLSRKVATPKCKYVQAGHQAVIGCILYNISRLDKATDGGELYLYLTEVRKIDAGST